MTFDEKPTGSGETHRMPERTFQVQAVTIQPIPAIPGVHSSTLTMTILAVISLKRNNHLRSL